MASSSGTSKFKSDSIPTLPGRPYVPIPFPTSPLESFPFDVFLSFRGLDTRNNFAGHLYSGLVHVGIHTFMDDAELHIGDQISLKLMKAIEESKIYIVIFSKNYASSGWCLDELLKMMECHNKSGRRVIPVFYGIIPAVVRHQTGSFADAFEKYEERPDPLGKVKRWRAALFEAADISGFDLERTAQGSESRLISLIVQEVLYQVKPRKLFVAKHPVGMDSRIKDACTLIRSLKSDGVCLIIGIWGMGGSGKTVIAKAIYNEMHSVFDSSCFLADVREVSGQQNGLVCLQKQLIADLMMTKNVMIGNVHEGIELIKQRLGRKKVLVVLDDMDKTDQANKLAGHRTWFGPGSVVIITTRHQDLLEKVKVKKTYEVKELNSEESLEFFCLHSFNKRSPPESHAALADEIVRYAGGLPLALEVLGSNLGTKPVDEWKSAVQKLKRIPPIDIHKILKISYDGLDDDEERNIFLDIAIYFVGMDKDYVNVILNGCGFAAEIGIRILKDRCLLLPDNGKNELRMHDLIRDMGREIVRKQFPEEPGRRSRLWIHEDVTDVLERNQGTEAIKGVALVSQIEAGIHLDARNFARMCNLRLLQFDNVRVNGYYDEYLRIDFRWIDWKRYSSKGLPPDSHLKKLVTLDMQHSSMRRALPGIQFLKNLKILNLSHSKCMTSTPDFRTVPNLVKIILEGCTSLLTIHPSIGLLCDLLFLNLKGCEAITTIPDEICKLNSLGYLNLTGCLNLQWLPKGLGCIELLREIFADDTAIVELPASLFDTKNLTSLSFKGCNKILAERHPCFLFFCSSVDSMVGREVGSNINEICLSLIDWIKKWTNKLTSPTGLVSLSSTKTPGVTFLPPSISGPSSLKRLILRNCALFDEDVPVDIGNLSALQELDLAGNNLSRLPSSFTQLTNLESLCLDNWSILQSLPELPPNLETLLAKNLRRPEETNLPDQQYYPGGFVD